MGERRGVKFLWRTAPRAPDALFAAVPELHPALLQVLYGRGLNTPDDCADFLAGVYREPDDPHLLTDLSRAVERLVAARARGETVAIFTDYDADGVNAAAVLASGLRLIGIEPRVRLPNRFRDGYGLSSAIVQELAQAGARVIVTADCGSTAHEAADTARALGVDLIVTDHHQCPPDLPNGFAIVNPWRADCQYPFDYLCGAGVAYKLLQALADALHPDGRGAMTPLLDLVAVATVADIMPLVGENRRLVMMGLEIMNAFPRPGVRALIDIAGLKPGEVDAAALGFRVAPRVNAAGRLDDPEIAYRLLMADSYEEAYELVTEVNRLNQERQQLTRTLEKEADAMVQSRLDAGAYTLVCGSVGWPSGIVGLVAGRLAQTHCRPSLVYTVRDGTASGSGRSIPGFDLLAALRACDDAGDGTGRALFDRYGGHQAAAGFSLATARLEELGERFEAAARLTMLPEQLEPVLRLDGYLRPDTLTHDFARALERLGPYGMSFAEPVFGMKGLTVVESRRVGNEGQHWRLRVRPRSGGLAFTAIGFGLGDLADRFPYASQVDAAFCVKRSQFNDEWRVDLHLQDVAPAEI